MKQDEKIISILQQDIELPDIVARKADAAFRQILAENHSKKRVRRWPRVAAVAAALLVLIIGGCVAKPELAAKIFAMLQGKVSYSGDYAKYAEPVAPQTSGQPAEEGTAENSAYTRTVNGVKVTIAEVYCNQEALSISMTIEGKEPFRDKLLVDQFGQQKLYLDLENTFSFKPQSVAGNGYLEGSFLDERTYVGIWRMDLANALTDNTANVTISLPEQFTVKMNLRQIIGDLAEQPELDWGMSTEALEALSEEEFTQLYNEVTSRYGIDYFPNAQQNYWMEGPWEYTVPVTVNNADTRTVTVSDTNEKGIGLASVTVTPFELGLNLIFEHNDSYDYYPVVLDANGKFMESASAGKATSLPVADHDISRITIYLCDYLEYMDEIKGKRNDDNFRQLLEERSSYLKEVTIQ